MSEDEIELLAQARVAASAGHKSTDYWDEPLACHRAGVRSEVAFADLYDLGYERIRRTVGVGADGGVDFPVYFDGKLLTFDVKARIKGGFDLLVKDAKFKNGTVADFFVLAYCHEAEKRVTFLGWEDSRIVRAERCDKLRVPTHLRMREDMRPMWQLDYLMRLRDGAKRRA